MNSRLYFALWPDDGIRVQLSRYREQLARAGSGRAVFPDTLHMTLAFLGEVEATQIPVIEKIGDGIKAATFNYTVNMAGCFPRAHIAWLGAKDRDYLGDSQVKLYFALLVLWLGSLVVVVNH